MTKAEYRARLAGRRVGIAGAGGLGSNCAVALARAGVGTLVVADFDAVSEDNLDRQAYYLDQVGRPKVEALGENLLRIAPNLRYVGRNLRLDPESALELFAGCDLVVEAFDRAEAKLMLLETLLSRMPGTPVVGASGIAGFGRVEELAVRRSHPLYLVGDQSSAVAPDLPPMAPRVGVAACMEADLVLEILLG